MSALGCFLIRRQVNNSFGINTMMPTRSMRDLPFYGVVSSFHSTQADQYTLGFRPGVSLVFCLSSQGFKAFAFACFKKGTEIEFLKGTVLPSLLLYSLVHPLFPRGI